MIDDGKLDIYGLISNFEWKINMIDCTCTAWRVRVLIFQDIVFALMFVPKYSVD